MPKRKRTVNDELDQKLVECEQELCRALKTAKGFERQRLSKRVQQDKAFPDKLQKYDREIAVLKSLDLQQTAHAHLSSALLRIKPVAEHPALPASFKVGAAKATVSDDDKVALHNVTSGLSNRPVVREVVEKAVRAVCLALEIPLPDKRRKGRKGEKELVHGEPEQAPVAGDKHTDGQEGGANRANQPQRDSDQSDSFEGFSDKGSEEAETVEEESAYDDMDENDEETAMAKYEALLGGSDSEEEDAEELRAKYGALLSANPEDLSPGEDEEDESDEYEDDLGSDGEDVDGERASDDEDDVEEAEEAEKSGSNRPKQPAMLPHRRSISPSRSPSPPPTARKPKEAKPSKPADSTTFLPSLMGGYFSGSESASDVDVAPRKKRLGQRQRQAIAERKHGEKANHVRKQMQQQQKQKGKGGRDSGWDMRRGAVDGEGGDKGRKPWKKGASDARGGGRGNGRGDGPGNHDPSGERRPRKGGHGGGQAADQGPLHPSWQARKKEKEAQQSAAFSGTKITF